MPLTTSQLESMRDLVGRGVTRPLSWRLDQLDRLKSLVAAHEQDLLSALASDLGKPQTEAFFEVVALLQELKLQRSSEKRLPVF